MRNNIYSLKIGTFKEIGSSTIIPEDGGTIDDESAYLKLTTTIAVSYTHLDVYKRQVRIMLGQVYNVEWRLEVVVRFKSYG